MGWSNNKTEKMCVELCHFLTTLPPLSLKIILQTFFFFLILSVF